MPSARKAGRSRLPHSPGKLRTWPRPGGAIQHAAVYAESAKANRFWISYRGFDSHAKYGRQRITLDNARFIGYAAPDVEAEEATMVLLMPELQGLAFAF